MEVAHRQQTRLQRASREAGFPFLKTVDDFNFTYQSTVRLPLTGSFLSADFVTEGRSLILYDKPGRRKTHLAVAIAYRAIQNGFDALFVTAAALIEELSVASRRGRLREAVAIYTRPHVHQGRRWGNRVPFGSDRASREPLGRPSLRYEPWGLRHC